MECEWAKAKYSKLASDNFELDLVDEGASVFLFGLILLGNKAVENVTRRRGNMRKLKYGTQFPI